MVGHLRCIQARRPNCRSKNTPQMRIPRSLNLKTEKLTPGRIVQGKNVIERAEDVYKAMCSYRRRSSVPLRQDSAFLFQLL